MSVSYEVCSLGVHAHWVNHWIIAQAHSDDEQEVGAIIASLSLGGPGILSFVEKRPGHRTKKSQLKLRLEHVRSFLLHCGLFTQSNDWSMN